jgi:ABC-2 type transport system ATP-binding protein
MLDKTDGKVQIDGNDISDQNAVRRTFGIVFQDGSLDDELTGRENMYFHTMLYGVPTATQEKEIKRLLEFVDL